MSSFWIMDGTFKSAPHLFYQIYIIHGNVRGGWFPLVLAVTESKSKTSELFLFELLKEKAMALLQRTLNPAYVSTDFERTVMDLVRM